MPSDLLYLGVLFALFVVPKVLQRFRVPAAVTSLVLGAAASVGGLFRNDPTIHLLASSFGLSEPEWEALAPARRAAPPREGP